MDKNFYIAQQTCLSKTELLAYLNKELPKEANRRVELHISSCSLCSDAIDALYPLSTEERKELLQPISFPLQVTKRKNTWLWAAASLFVVVSALSAFLIFNKNDSNTILAKNETKVETTIQSNTEVTLPENNPVKKEDTVDKNNSLIINKKTIENITPTEKIKVTESEDKQAPIKENKAANAEATISDATIASAPPKESAPASKPELLEKPKLDSKTSLTQNATRSAIEEKTPSPTIAKEEVVVKKVTASKASPKESYKALQTEDAAQENSLTIDNLTKKIVQAEVSKNYAECIFLYNQLLTIYKKEDNKKGIKMCMDALEKIKLLKN